MKNIFINGLNSKAGGGKTILNNYLALLRKSNAKNNFFVLTPQKKEYQNYSCNFIHIIDIAALYKKVLLYPLLNRYVLPKLLKELNIDAVLNMADIVIPTDISQLYLFDWAYGVYPDSLAWKRMDMLSYLKNRVKLFYFRKYIKNATVIIAQTRTMKEKLQFLYGQTNIEIVPNAVSLKNISRVDSFDFNLPKDKFKLLYLTYYYPHKNIEVFLLLAKKIKDMKLPYCLIITIDAAQHKGAKKFLDAVKREGLANTIINVGPVPMAKVASLYSQTDALLMPTLLESFSGTYVEAMFHKKVILTSKLDSVKDVCGDAAFYFDPLDVDSILKSINIAYNNSSLRKLKIENARSKLSYMLSWQQVFEKWQYLLESVIC